MGRGSRRNGEKNETTIRLRIEELDEGGYVATSPDVPGLVAEGRSVMEAVEIAQGLTRKIIELHRGEISIQNDSKGGVKVSLVFHENGGS